MRNALPLVDGGVHLDRLQMLQQRRAPRTRACRADLLDDVVALEPGDRDRQEIA